jgi:hypothetical protein
MKAAVVNDHDAFESAGPGAVFLWRYGVKVAKGGDNGHIMLKCPGCGSESGMHVRSPGIEHPKSGQSWEISGLPDAITLSPSINCVGCCGWHGYLTNGEYSKC